MHQVGCPMRLRNPADAVAYPEIYAYPMWHAAAHRNVTIRKAGDATHTDDWPVLDLNYTPAAVQICSTCVVTLSDLVIKRERRGTGPVYDFFIGQPGSRLRSINTIRVWEMCTPGSALLKLVKSLRRSPLFPNSTAPQEAGLVENITWKVRRNTTLQLAVPA